MKTCSKCQSDFEPSANNARKQSSVCPSCQRVYDAAYRAKRKADGNPVRTGSMNPEYHRKRRAAYTQRPEVKTHLAEKARKRLLDPVERPKHEARWKVRREIAEGRMTRQPCEVCGDTVTDAHHDDYGKPLDIRWLCKPCHRKHHAALAKEGQK